MSYLNFFRFLLTFLIVTTVTAEIVSGKCPEVYGHKFNCSDIIRNFPQHTRHGSKLHLLIYGFLPSSLESESINLFSYNFGENVNISDYFAILDCNQSYNGKMVFNIQCGTKSQLNSTQ